jgi:hypothetical protein
MYSTLTRDLSSGITSLFTVLDLFCLASSSLSTELISTLDWLTDLARSVSYNWQPDGIKYTMSNSSISCFPMQLVLTYSLPRKSHCCAKRFTQPLSNNGRCCFFRCLGNDSSGMNWLFRYHWSMCSGCRHSLAMDVNFDSYNQVFRRHATILSLLCLGLPSDLFPSTFTSICTSYVSHTCYIFRTFHPHWYDHPKTSSEQ